MKDLTQKLKKKFGNYPVLKITMVQEMENKKGEFVKDEESSQRSFSLSEDFVAEIKQAVDVFVDYYVELPFEDEQFSISKDTIRLFHLVDSCRQEATSEEVQWWQDGCRSLFELKSPLVLTIDDTLITNELLTEIFEEARND